MNQPLPNGKANFVIVKMHKSYQACKYFWTTNMSIATMEIYHNFDVASILTLFLKVFFLLLFVIFISNLVCIEEVNVEVHKKNDNGFK